MKYPPPADSESEHLNIFLINKQRVPSISRSRKSTATRCLHTVPQLTNADYIGEKGNVLHL